MKQGTQEDMDPEWCGGIVTHITLASPVNNTSITSKETEEGNKIYDFLVAQRPWKEILCSHYKSTND